MELILIPILSGLIAAWAGKWSRWIALLGSIITGVLVVTLWSQFDPTKGFQFIFDKPWFSSAIHFKTGIDGIGLLLLLLTNFLTPVILLSAFGKDKQSLVFALIVAMQGALNGVFLALDGLMFYIFWELALIPIYFIAGMWGEGDRFKTTIRFFIYTFIGSLGMLASLLYLYSKTPDPSSFSWEALVAVKLSVKEAIAVGTGLLLAFAVKIPILPFHGWQPKTYVESPSFGTMLLSGIMLKMGLYGLIRWFMPLVPEALSFYNPIIVTLGIAGVIYGAYIAIRQKDLKGIVAYSSLSHVGLIAAGIATLSFTGLQGGLLQMLSHGVNAVGLFFAIDIIERRLHTRSLNQLGGIAKVAPLFSVLFIILVFGATAVPFTNGFPGELLLLKSIFSFHAWQGIIAGLTIILCAVYMLRLFQFSMFGKANNDQLTSFGALQWHETLGMMVLVLFVVFFGLFPQTLLDISGPSIQQLQQVIEQSKEVLS